MVNFTFGPLAYGAANIGNLYRELSDEESWSILDTAWRLGIRYFDTSPHYGLGLSERRLGAFLQTKPRDEFIVSTKVGRLIRPNPEGAGTLDLDHDFAVPADHKRVWDLSAEGVRTSLEESLERLGLESVDILYLHDPERHDLEQGINESLPALAELRDSGTVGAIGIGSMVNDALLRSIQSGLLDLVMVAGRYTLADQSAAQQVLPAAREHGVGIVSAAVFNSGLLATDNPSDRSRFDYDTVTPELLERVTAIAQACRDLGVSLPTAALQFGLRDPIVRTIVVGASRPEQLEENAGRMAQAVPNELWSHLVESELIPA